MTSFDMFHQLHCLVRTIPYYKGVTECSCRITYARLSIETTILKHQFMAEFTWVRKFCHQVCEFRLYSWIKITALTTCDKQFNVVEVQL
jgi:hypothetical protein